MIPNGKMFLKRDRELNLLPLRRRERRREGEHTNGERLEELAVILRFPTCWVDEEKENPFVFLLFWFFLRGLRNRTRRLHFCTVIRSSPLF
jgi:hypothetical protein